MSTHTIKIIDDNKQLLDDLYDSRIELNPAMAIRDIQMYSLPYYNYSTLPKMKTPSEASLLSLDLTDESAITQAEHIKKQCPACQSKKYLFGKNTQLCLECWSIALARFWRAFPIKITHLGQILDSPSYIPSDLRFITLEPWLNSLYNTSTLQQFNQEARMLIRGNPAMTHSETIIWDSPKKAFLIREIGCIACRYIPPFDESWLWSAQYRDWYNGLCPECAARKPFKIRDTVWGMTTVQYMQWQEMYLQPRFLHRTIARYGALALLLVESSKNWGKHVSKLVPSIRTGTKGKVQNREYLQQLQYFLSTKEIAAVYKDAEKQLFKKRPKTLEEIGVDSFNPDLFNYPTVPPFLYENIFKELKDVQSRNANRPILACKSQKESPI